MMSPEQFEEFKRCENRHRIREDRMNREASIRQREIERERKWDRREPVIILTMVLFGAFALGTAFGLLIAP